MRKSGAPWLWDSDGSSGTSWAQAWRTLTHARTSVTLSAGDSLTLYLRHGDTIEGYYDSDQSPTAPHPSRSSACAMTSPTRSATIAREFWVTSE